MKILKIPNFSGKKIENQKKKKKKKKGDNKDSKNEVDIVLVSLLLVTFENISLFSSICLLWTYTCLLGLVSNILKVPYYTYFFPMANTPYNAAKTIKEPHPINVEISKQRKHGGNAKLKERV